MLGKLIKHEWKDTYKVAGLIMILIAGITLVGAIAFVLPYRFFENNHETMQDSFFFASWMFVMFMSLMLYVFTMIGALYGLLIYLGVHFYKTMFSDEGYLTQTLPVTKHQLLFSKTLVGGLWYLLLEIVIALSFLTLVLAICFATLYGTVDGSSLLGELSEVMSPEVWEEFGSEVGMQGIHVVISLVLMGLIAPFSTVLMVFGSLTIGQLSGKYKVLVGILSYFGVLLVHSIVSRILQTVFTFGSALMSSRAAMLGANSVNMAGVYDSSIVVQIMMGTALYFIAHHILTKKLNLD